MAGPGPRRARLRRADLRRAGPGHERDPPARGPGQRAAVLQPLRRARATASSTAARASRSSSCRTSWSAPRTRSTSSCRRPSAPYANPAPPARSDDSQPVLAAGSTGARTAHRHPGPHHALAIIGHSHGRRRGVEGAGHRPRGWRRSSRSTSSPAPASTGRWTATATCRRCPALARPVGVRLHRLAVPAQRRQLADPQPSPGGPGPDAGAPHRLRRLGEGRPGLDARRAAGLHPPRVHRHPARAARPAATART